MKIMKVSDTAGHLEIVQGDITKQQVDAIVNAANKSLLGGGGVDGAIHRAAGPELLEECRKIGGCETGQVKITKGYNLPAENVIHTVGPVYGQENGREEKLLVSCYHNSLKLVEQQGLNSVAFPAISTGVYGYPKEKAARIAICAVKEVFKQTDWGIAVVFVLFDEENASIYRRLLESLE